MRTAFLIAAALAASPTLAQTPVPHPGEKILDSKGARVGEVDHVNPDGSVTLVWEMGFVTLPADTLSIADGVIKTSLSRKDVSHLKQS